MKRNLTPVALLLILCLHGAALLAQDAQQSQVYMAPLLLNPAFTGTMEYACKDHKADRMRFATSYRNQWGGTYQTSLLSGDYVTANGRLGLGGTLTYDKSGTPAVRQTQVTAVAAYHLPLRRGRVMSHGLALGVADRRINAQDLVLPDQYRPDFYRTNLNPTQDPQVGAAPRLYPDVAYGFTYHTERLSAGLAGWHLNRPNFSLSSEVETLATRLQAHAAYVFPLHKKQGAQDRPSSKPKAVQMRSEPPGPSVTAFSHLKYQSGFFSADAGGWFTYHKLLLGTWYRAFPLSGPGGYPFSQSQAFVLMAGISTYAHAGYVRAALSYDYPTSSTLRGLPPALELTLSFQPMRKACVQRPLYSRIPAPAN